MSFKFPTATESRSISDLRILHAENCAIEKAILDARDLGLRTAIVENSTPMTTSVEHWQAWQDGPIECDDQNSHLLDLQNKILDCFRMLKYSIVRKTYTPTGNTFYWEIKW